MIKQKSSMGTTVRCPRCKYENLAIDIWCARCGTPVDWDGTRSPSAKNGHGAKAETRNGRPSGLARLAGGLPWRKAQAPVASPAPVAAPPTNGTAPTASEPAPIAKRPTPEPAPIAKQPAPEPIPVAKPPVPVPVPVAQQPDPAPGPVANEPVPEPAPAAIAATSKPAAAPASPARVFCPDCGQANQAGTRFCPRCGHGVAGATGTALAATARSQPGTTRRRPTRNAGFTLPRLDLSRFRMPRIPIVAWAIAAVVALLILAPLAYVLSPSGRHLVAGRTSKAPTVTKAAPPATGSSSALAAAIPGVEAKTGLKYTAGSCPANGPCLKLASQSNGLNAAVVQFTTAKAGGRQCAGYAFQDASGWHFLNATCAVPGQVTPQVGNAATVHVPGQCANVRDAAGLAGNVIVCLNDGTAVHVDGGPNYADGKLWWHLEKQGWMAHDFLISA